jgi:hypothetical protein
LRKLLRRLITAASIIVAIIAALDQLGRAPADRDWHGAVLGIPYDFRFPSLARALQRLWSREDERMIVPTVFGVGWTVNLYQVVRRMGLLIA